MLEWLMFRVFYNITTARRNEMRASEENVMKLFSPLKVLKLD